MRCIQLIESVPVETPLGPGVAIIFEGGEHDNAWTVILETGALVTFKQSEIRASRSWYPRVNMTEEQMKEIIRGKEEKKTTKERIEEICKAAQSTLPSS